MKKTIAMILAAFAFATSAMAGTVNVFCQNLGGDIKTPTTEQQAAYVSFLSSNNIDFGVFYGPTSAGNFGLTAEGYTATLEYNSGTSSYGKGRVLLYKTALWEVAAHYSPVNYYDSGKMWCESYVMQRKSNGEQFLVVFCTGNRFDKGSYCNPLRTYAAEKAALHPGAWTLIALPYNNSLGKIYSGANQLSSNLTGNGYTRTFTASDTGAVFAKNHTTLSQSGAAVSQTTLGFGSEPAATATVTYQRSLTVVFNDWDGTELKSETVLEGEDATPPADPERVGHHFSGWSGSYQNVQASVTLVAQYNPDMFTVRFLDWDGELLKSELVAYGTDATPPEDPVRDGYRFIGWNASYTGITGAVDITALYADASSVTHWVTFKDWDGTELSRQEVIDGQDAVLPADPTREGWHFTGWSGTYTGVTQDETVTATYAINAYEIVFTDWDGTVLKTQTVAHGSDATPPANPSRTGYHFTGWSGAYQNVQAAATIVAQYQIDTFTVRFQYADGTEIATQQVEYMGSATAPSNPSPREENTFFYKWDRGYSSITADTVVTAVFVPAVIEIDTAAEFAEYMGSTLVSKSGITFALTRDLSLSGVSYSTQSLSATIDGRGHTLSNIPGGFKLVSDIRGGTVRNLVFSGYRSPGNKNQTQLVASQTYVNSTISGVVMTNCQWTLPSGSYGTAGFVYEVKQGTTITNCTMIDCKITGSNCGGNYKGEPQLIGGFVGKASSLTMVDCHFIVSDTDAVAVGDGISVAGALVGKCGSGVTIKRCSNNGFVKAAKQVYSNIGGAGGIVGIAYSSGSPTIVDCANFGKVESTVDYPAGGIIGEMGTNAVGNVTFSLSLKSCYNYGVVSSPLAAGGLVGSYCGATSVLANNGNAGTVSSPAGFAGGLVGRLGFNGSTKTAGFENVFQCGAVSTESGFAGILAGGLFSSTGSGLTLAVNNAWMAGSATASAGGKAGLAIGGCDAASTGALALSVTGGGVLNSNASLAAGYDAAGQALEWTAPAAFAPSALVDRTVLDSLDGVARAQSLTRWIPGEEFPELETFGTEFSPGMILMWW